MTELIHEIVIDRPIDDVFHYATAPYYWPRWHPSTLAVDLKHSNSLTEGKVVVEDIKAGPIKDHVTWTVREYEAPNLWMIQGVAKSGATAVLQYYLTHWSGKTQFRRVLNYQTPNIFMAIGDFIIGKQLMKTKAEKAFANLKSRLENYL